MSIYHAITDTKSKVDEKTTPKSRKCTGKSQRNVNGGLSRSTINKEPDHLYKRKYCISVDPGDRENHDNAEPPMKIQTHSSRQTHAELGRNQGQEL